MAWSDGEAGTDIIVSGLDVPINAGGGDDINTDPQVEYVFTTTDSKSWYCYLNEENKNMGVIAIEFLESSPYGMYSGWVMYEKYNSNRAYYANTTAPSDADIATICAGPWEADFYGGSDIPTFTSSGSPAGWVKTDALVEGLEVKGYTPVSGSVYSADTTIYCNMYSDENPAGGSTAPEAGSARVIIMFGVINDTSSYDWGGVYGFTPTNTSATGTNRVWEHRVDSDLYRQIKWDSSSGRWVMYDGVSWNFNMYTGDDSEDPWDCTWTALEAPS